MAQIAVTVVYLEDQAELENLLDQIASPSLLPSEQVKQVLEFLREKPVITNNSYVFFPFLSVLRPSPRQVAEQGGDCADRSRLLIALLYLRGIEASKWALYSEDLRPEHAVTEVHVESGKMVVDPLYGLWFPRLDDGGYYGIKDLKDHPEILRDRIEELRSRDKQPGALSIARYPLDKYIYNYARTINWDKFIGMQAIYRVLKSILGEFVNEIPRPYFVEQPALMVLIGLAFLEGGVLIAWYVSIRLRIGRTGRDQFKVYKKFEG